MDFLQPPPGGDQDRGLRILALFWAPFPVMVVMVVGRILVRRKMKNLGADDILMAISLFIYAAGAVPFHLFALRGGSRHIFYIDLSQLPLLILLNLVSQPFASASLLFGKVSIAFLVLRITGYHHRWQRLLIYISVVVYVVLTILLIVLTFVQCSPPRALWDNVPGEKCWSPHVTIRFAVAQSSFGTYIDLLLAVVPSSIIWTLTISRKQKLGLCALLSLGGVAAVFSVLKIVHVVDYADKTDFTWEVYPIFMWALAENSLVIVLGSVSPLKPLFDWWRTGKPVAPPSTGSSQNLLSRKQFSWKFSNFRRMASISRLTNNPTSTPEESAFDEEGSISLGQRGITVEHSYQVASQRNDSAGTDKKSLVHAGS